MMTLLETASASPAADGTAARPSAGERVIAWCAAGLLCINFMGVLGLNMWFQAVDEQIIDKADPLGMPSSMLLPFQMIMGPVFWFVNLFAYMVLALAVVNVIVRERAARRARGRSASGSRRWVWIGIVVSVAAGIASLTFGFVMLASLDYGSWPFWMSALTVPNVFLGITAFVGVIAFSVTGFPAPRRRVVSSR